MQETLETIAEQSPPASNQEYVEMERGEERAVFPHMQLLDMDGNTMRFDANGIPDPKGDWSASARFDMGGYFSGGTLNASVEVVHRQNPNNPDETQYAILHPVFSQEDNGPWSTTGMRTLSVVERGQELKVGRNSESDVPLPSLSNVSGEHLRVKDNDGTLVVTNLTANSHTMAEMGSVDSTLHYNRAAIGELAAEVELGEASQHMQPRDFQREVFANTGAHVGGNPNKDSGDIPSVSEVVNTDEGYFASFQFGQDAVSYARQHATGNVQLALADGVGSRSLSHITANQAVIAAAAAFNNNSDAFLAAAEAVAEDFSEQRGEATLTTAQIDKNGAFEVELIADSPAMIIGENGDVKQRIGMDAPPISAFFIKRHLDLYNDNDVQQVWDAWVDSATAEELAVRLSSLCDKTDAVEIVQKAAMSANIIDSTLAQLVTNHKGQDVVKRAAPIEGRLEDGDTLIIMSDGIADVLTPQQIAEALQNGQNLADLVKKVSANPDMLKGKSDDISFISHTHRSA